MWLKYDLALDGCYCPHSLRIHLRREARLRVAKIYRNNNRDKIKIAIDRWVKNNPDRVRDIKEKYLSNNIDTVKNNHRKSREKHKDRASERGRIYRKSNPDKIRAYVHTRRAKN